MIPENIFDKILLYLSHPLADIFMEHNDCLIKRVKHVPDLNFYPALYEHIKNNPTKQIYFLER